jgi:hypothetical protein
LISYPERGQIDTILENRPYGHGEARVVSAGERILGLGDMEDIEDLIFCCSGRRGELTMNTRTRAVHLVQYLRRCIMQRSLVAFVIAFVLLVALQHALAATATGKHITTVAGSGAFSDDPTTALCGDGGPASGAAFFSPRGLRATPDGGYLVADRFDNRIHKVSAISRNAIITTIAGTGDPCPVHTDLCGDGGPTIEALLGGPRSIALTPDGGFLFTDARINRVRQVSANGTITTVAGTGEPCLDSTHPCGDGGQVLKAEHNGPQDIQLIGGGRFLIADGGDTDNPDFNVTNRIRLVAPPGLQP